MRELQAGLLGAVTSHEDYCNNDIVRRAFGANQIPIWTLVIADDEPALDDRATNKEGKAYDREWKIWDRHSKMCILARSDHRNLIINMFLSIPEYIRTVLIAQNAGEENITARHKVVEMSSRFPTYLTQNMRNLKTRLRAFDFRANGNIHEHMAELQQIFQIFNAAGATYSEFEKIEKAI